jgi:hypothetical protein
MTIGLGAGTFLDMTSDPNLDCGLFQFGIFRPECWAAAKELPAGTGAAGVPIEAWVGVGMVVMSLLLLRK